MWQKRGMACLDGVVCVEAELGGKLHSILLVVRKKRTEPPVFSGRTVRWP